MEDIIIRLKETDMNVVNRANKRLNHKELEDKVSIEYLLDIVDELVDEVDYLEDRYKNLKEEVDEYYTLKKGAIDYE